MVPKDLMDLQEAEELCETANYQVIFKLLKGKRIDKNYYLNKNELSLLKNKDLDSTTLIIYDLLKPRQFSNLMRELGVEVLDKVLLLLNVFALHSGSKEAELQIELARLKYEMPIIKYIINISKRKELQGPIGGGKYGFDKYYKMYRTREARIKTELWKIKDRNTKLIENRKVNGLKQVVLAGHTNAGKTSIFNKLTQLNMPTGEDLFTTITPKRRKISIAGLNFLLVDTVGFITDVPPQIIESFHLTLAELMFSDVILYVLDSSLSEDKLTSRIKSGFQSMREIGISGRPLLLLLNKIDLISPVELERKIKLSLDISKKLFNPIINVIPISARTGKNFELLKDAIHRSLVE